jgi:hypothetical protein
MKIQVTWFDLFGTSILRHKYYLVYYLGTIKKQLYWIAPGQRGMYAPINEEIIYEYTKL